MDEANDLAEAAPQLLPSKEAPIICFCAVGGRASTAKKALDALGYTNVINAGGLADVRALAESLTAEGRLERLGTELPELAAIGRYVPYRLVGNMLYVSGSSARPRYQPSLLLWLRLRLLRQAQVPNLPYSSETCPYSSKKYGKLLLTAVVNSWPRVIGKVPDEVSFEEAKAAARSTGISILSIVKGALGSLDHVKRVVKR